MEKRLLLFSPVGYNNATVKIALPLVIAEDVVLGVVRGAVGRIVGINRLGAVMDFWKSPPGRFMATAAAFWVAIVLSLSAGAQVPQELVEAMRKAPAGERDHFLAELERRGAEAVPALTHALDDVSPDIRRGASHVLARLGSAAEPALPGLAKALTDTDEHVRRNAADAISRIGPPASRFIPDLIAALGNRQDGDLCYYAIRAIGAVGPGAKDAVQTLLELEHDPHRPLWVHAAVALGQIGPAASPAIPAIVRLMEDRQLNAYRAAAEALAGIGADAIPSLADRLGSENPTTVYWSTMALGRMGEPAVPVLVRGLQGNRAHVRGWSAAALGTIGARAETAVGSLAAMLDDPNDAPRARAARALARIGLPAALAHLRTALGSKSPRVREAAASALADMGPVAGPAVPALAQALADPDDGVCYQAAEALGRIGLQALAPACEALASADTRVRAAAATALGELASNARPPPEVVARSAIAALAPLLADPDIRVRRCAAEALGKHEFRAIAAVAALTRAMDDADATVRYRSAKALARIDSASSSRYEARAEAMARGVKIVPYAGQAADLTRLRMTEEVNGPDVVGSSGAAVAGARRLFKNVPMIGMTRTQVLELLGDPATISSYGRAAEAHADAPLDYIVDTGFGGSRYTLRFLLGRVFGRIEVTGID